MKVFTNPQSYSQTNDIIKSMPLNRNVFLPGKSKLLITSVHGYHHIREGNIKSADFNSLFFAALLATCGNHHLGVCNEDYSLDSNHHKDTSYKYDLAEYVAKHDIDLIVDIHTIHSTRPFDTDVGTQHGKTIPAEKISPLFALFNHSGFWIGDNILFAAEGIDGGETITSYSYHTLNIHAIQLEISAGLLEHNSSYYQIHQQMKFTNYLLNFLDNYSGYY